jgi:hypothetical protein
MFKKKFTLLMSAILLIASFSARPVLAAEQTSTEATANNVTWNYVYTVSCHDHPGGGLTVNARITRKYTQTDPTYAPTYKIISVQTWLTFSYITPGAQVILEHPWTNHSISANKQNGSASGGGIAVVQFFSPFGYFSIYSEPISCTVNF